MFGERNFAYAGDSHEDLHVWAHAESAIVVSSNNRLALSAAEKANDMHLIKTPRPQFFVYLRALRAHQWLKNVLIATPMMAAHQHAVNDFMQFLMLF